MADKTLDPIAMSSPVNETDPPLLYKHKRGETCHLLEFVSLKIVFLDLKIFSNFVR